MSKPINLFRSCLAAMLVAFVSSAQANDLGPNAVKAAVVEIAARFEKDTGRRVSLTWDGGEAIAKRVADGEVFDVVIS